MEDKIDLILTTLKEAAQVEFSRLLSGLHGLGAKMHGVMTFLASLELTRRRRLFLRQIQPFAELWLYRREAPEEDEEPGSEAAEAAPDEQAGEER
jgi:chromatin segregation and condensation protein Rec8/ScpA/Scc1 (kleisin family)